MGAAQGGTRMDACRAFLNPPRGEGGSARSHQKDLCGAFPARDPLPWGAFHNGYVSVRLRHCADERENQRTFSTNPAIRVLSVRLRVTVCSTA